MRYVSLGYYDEKKWQAMFENERCAPIDARFADDVLRKNGHFAGGQVFQGRTLVGVEKPNHSPDGVGSFVALSKGRAG